MEGNNPATPACRQPAPGSLSARLDLLRWLACLFLLIVTACQKEISQFFTASKAAGNSQDNRGYGKHSPAAVLTWNQAARENALSRIYIGFHFRKAALEGETHDRNIGRRVFEHHLREK